MKTVTIYAVYWDNHEKYPEDRAYGIEEYHTSKEAAEKAVEEYNQKEFKRAMEDDWPERKYYEVLPRQLIIDTEEEDAPKKCCANCKHCKTTWVGGFSDPVEKAYCCKDTADMIEKNRLSWDEVCEHWEA